MRPSHPVRHFWPLRNQRFLCSRLRSRLLVERLGMQTRGVYQSCAPKPSDFPPPSSPKSVQIRLSPWGKGVSFSDKVPASKLETRNCCLLLAQSFNAVPGVRRRLLEVADATLQEHGRYDVAGTFGACS